MKSLDLKRGLQGQLVGFGSVVEGIVNYDGLSPSLQLDFEELGRGAYVEQSGERQYQRDFTLLDTACARASGATNPEWDFSNGGEVGSLDEHGVNTVRWNPIAGLLEEAASTNLLANPRFEGAVAGSPGTTPTGWETYSNTGSGTIDGSGYESGWPYLDRTHVPSGAGVTLLFSGLVPVTAGVTYTFSSGHRLLSGDSGSEVTLVLSWRTAAGAFISESQLVVAPSDLHKRSFLTAAAPATATQVAVELRVGTSTGSSSVKVRFYAPQFELGSAPSSPILPAIGTPAASTRATETVTGLTTVTRASRKTNAGEWDFTNGGAVGAFREYLPNVPAITGKGLLVEEGTTNHIPNPRFEGAVIGAAASVAAPTGMAWANNGNTITITAARYEQGWPYVEARFQVGSGSQAWLTFDAAQVVLGDVTSTVSAGVKVVGGSTANASCRFVRAVFSGATFLTDNNGDLFTPDASHKRYFAAFAQPGAGADRYQSSLRVVATGGAVDVTLRIYAPQHEVKAHPTSPVLPPKGTIAASTRAADSIEVGNGAWANAGDSTLYIEAAVTAPNVAGSFARYAAFGTALGNQLALIQFTTSGVAADIIDGGVDNALNIKAVSAGDEVRAAIAYSVNDGVSSVSGNAQVTDTSVDLSLTGTSPSLHIGQGQSGGGANVQSAYIKQLRYFPVRKTNAELEALVGNS